jgi:leucyl-tRNA synthetase
VKFTEPFQVLRNQGMIWAADGQKMSKSKGNVVTPDAMVEKYGADALRLGELFMGPFEEATNWNEEGVVGTARYLNRVWNVVRRYVELGSPEGNPAVETLKRAHKAIRTVTDHIERLRFNTALAALMDQLNYLQKLAPYELGRFAVESYVVLLAPMAPHITEEMWRALGHKESVHLEPWPKYDLELTRDETVTVVVQINGKVRDRLQVEAGTPEAQVQQMALSREVVGKHLNGKPPKKVIYVPDKLLSIVA